VELRYGGIPWDVLEHSVPVARASDNLEGFEVGRLGDQTGEALAVVELLEGQRLEAWARDGDGLRVSEAAEALDGELLEVEAGAEDSLDSLGPEGAGANGELAEVGGGGGERGDPVVGDGAQGAQLEAAQARAESVGDEREGRVADALGAAVALERELGDGGEAREEAGQRGVGEERRPGVEREAEAGSGLRGEPAAADEGAALAVAGAEEAEDEGEELLGEVGRVVLPCEGGEERRRRRRCRRREGRRRERRRGLAAARGGGALAHGGAAAAAAAAADLPRKGRWMG